MHGIVIIPLIETLDDCFLVQTDDGNAVSNLDNLKKFFDSWKKLGTASGYHHTKGLIITKEIVSEKAQQIFVNDEVAIIEGCTVFGSVIGFDYAEKNCRKITKTAEITVKKDVRTCQCYTSKCLKIVQFISLE